MKIAVTSVSGQLGKAIAQQLINDIGTENVVGIARTPSKVQLTGIEVRRGDYGNKEEFLDALYGVDAVVLISGNDAPEKRIQQHRNVIEAAKENGLQKIIYTSILGGEEETSFNAVVQSNRTTEEDIKTSGLDWSIGRNGIYIEPDLEFIDTYVKEGKIRNSAGTGKCCYTSRNELALAYSNMARETAHSGKTYSLVGEPVEQRELAETMNLVFNTNLKFENVPVHEYLKERKAALGDMMGTIISGIYHGIKSGTYDVTSDFAEAAGSPHKSLEEMMRDFRKNQEA